jgi:DNA-binding beta-propeller fold protein YncE
MTRRVFGGTLASVLAVVAMGAPPTSAADGIPAPYANGENGISAPGGGHRYVVLSGRETTVARIATADGRVTTYRTLKPGYVLPGVAYDGTPGGLSADGQMLVLQRSAVYGGPMRFALLDGRKLHVRKTIHLHGNFNFDAVSPDGSRIYLIEYLSATNPTKYAVREYDVARDRLVAQPIVDPDEHAGEMRGQPLTRAYSPDGRWAYTLYNGGEEPFVHALDTVAGKAVCIDLPGFDKFKLIAGRTQLNVAPDGSSFDLVDRGSSVASVDTATFEVSTPSENTDPGGGELPWSAIVAAAALAALVAAASLIARRRHREPAAGDVT